MLTPPLSDGIVDRYSRNSGGRPARDIGQIGNAKGVKSARDGTSIHHHRPNALAFVHQIEPLVDILQRQDMGD